MEVFGSSDAWVVIVFPDIAVVDGGSADTTDDAWIVIKLKIAGDDDSAGVDSVVLVQPVGVMMDAE